MAVCSPAAAAAAAAVLGSAVLISMHIVQMYYKAEHAVPRPAAAAVVKALWKGKPCGKSKKQSTAVLCMHMTACFFL
jgi:hypothetical protein